MPNPALPFLVFFLGGGRESPKTRIFIPTEPLNPWQRREILKKQQQGNPRKRKKKKKQGISQHKNKERNDREVPYDILNKGTITSLSLS